MLRKYNAAGEEMVNESGFAPQAVVLRVGLSANSAGAAPPAAVPFDTRVFDPFASWDGANYRFQPKIPGYYKITAQIGSNDTTADRKFAALLYKNGVNVAWGVTNAGRGGNRPSSIVSDTIYLNGTTDYVTAAFWSSTAPAPIFGSITETYMTAELTAASVGVAPEPWHVVGNSGEPAFQNGWVALGGNEPPPRFFKDPHGIVHLEGAVKNGTNDSAIFTLPVGYRPAYTLNGLTARNGSTGAINGFHVGQDGQVMTLNMGANGNVAFDGINFRAEA